MICWLAVNSMPRIRLSSYLTIFIMRDNDLYDLYYNENHSYKWRKIPKKMSITAISNFERPLCIILYHNTTGMMYHVRHRYYDKSPGV